MIERDRDLVPPFDGEPHPVDPLAGALTEQTPNELLADPGVLVVLMDEDGELVGSLRVGDERGVAGDGVVMPLKGERDATEGFKPTNQDDM